MVGQEYELEHKLHGGDRRSKTFEEKSKAQNEPLKSTAEKIAEEHGVSRETVKRSADLYNSVKIIGEVAPEVAREIESETIKATQTDIVAVGEALETASPEEKEQLVGDIRVDFKEAAKKVKSKKPKKQKKEPEVVIRPPSAIELWCNDCEWGFDVYPNTKIESTFCPYCKGDNLDKREENWEPTEANDVSQE